MEAKNKEARRIETQPSNFGETILAGAIFCLAAYGTYKLFQKETSQPTALPGSGVDSQILQKIIEQEMKS